MQKSSPRILSTQIIMCFHARDGDGAAVLILSRRFTATCFDLSGVHHVFVLCIWFCLGRWEGGVPMYCLPYVI